MWGKTALGPQSPNFPFTIHPGFDLHPKGLLCLGVDSPVPASELYPYTPKQLPLGLKLVHQQQSLGGGTQAQKMGSEPLSRTVA